MRLHKKHDTRYMIHDDTLCIHDHRSFLELGDPVDLCHLASFGMGDTRYEIRECEISPIRDTRYEIDIYKIRDTGYRMQDT